MDIKIGSLLAGVKQTHTLVKAHAPTKTNDAAQALFVKPADVNSTDKVKGTQEAQGGQVERLALDKAVAELNRNVQKSTRALRFTIDETHGKPIVTVVDKETDKVIRQIPSEVALQVADALDEVAGVLVSEHA